MIPDVEEQLRLVERDALCIELIRLCAAEDLLALVDEELAAARRTLVEMSKITGKDQS